MIKIMALLILLGLNLSGCDSEPTYCTTKSLINFGMLVVCEESCDDSLSLFSKLSNNSTLGIEVWEQCTKLCDESVMG